MTKIVQADHETAVPLPPGKQVLRGTVDPVTGVGSDGDYYINVTTLKIFGPKATTWPTGKTIVTQPVAVTGSKGSNAALTSLISALVSLGLITDQTS